MSLYLYNSLSAQKELFVPLDEKLIKMYVCGPTVYDLIHLGNARSLVVYDVLYRTLKHIYGADSVLYVRNITDVDDKINIRAKELGISIFELTEQTTQAFHQDTAYLNCLEPNIEPKATQHLEQMISMIQKLLSNGSAYIQNNTVYFDVTCFQDYGKLSGRKLDELISGARIEVETSKRHPQDFVLWKPEDSHDDPSAVFDSPWGKGQPGWHIECSSMAHHYLGTDFDIHGGGVDIIFPHHTNEIAQSCRAFPGSKYAKYWVHNGLLKSNGEKMSKSLGNFFTVADIREQHIPTDVIRYTLLNTHYHKPLDFNDNVMREAKENVEYLTRVTKDIQDNYYAEIAEEFLSFLFDNLNTHAALNYILKLAKIANKTGDQKIKESIKYCANFLGLLELQSISNQQVSTEEVEKLISQRAEAKLAKNWQLADKIRDDLKAKGVILEDLKNGRTIWHI
jgi:cysteinyl-tRNA synthetase